MIQVRLLLLSLLLLLGKKLELLIMLAFTLLRQLGLESHLLLIVHWHLHRSTLLFQLLLDFVGIKMI
jgi:hypothetical protein